MRKNKHGFTIVELVCVIAVIAVLAAVLIPTFGGIVEKANNSSAIQNAKNAYTEYLIGNAQSGNPVNDFLYYGENGQVIVIKDGSVSGTVYADRESALAALTDNEIDRYEIKQINDYLIAVVLKASADNFSNGNIYLSESKTLEDGADSVDFTLYHESLLIAEISVPAAAIADPTKPVTVTITSIKADDTIDVDENTRAYAYDIDVTNLKESLTEDEFVSVSLAAPNALPHANAYHNGELIGDATYLEVEGAVTFKTGSFSPFAVSYLEYEASTIDELREYTAIDNAYVKLTADIEAQLNKEIDGNVCDFAHSGSSSSFSNSEGRCYFLVKIGGVNVTLDLNGHTIATYDSLNGESGKEWCGGTFYISSGASLNITDTAGGGKVKAMGPHYIVWANYWSDEAWCDIYGGIFMSDSYVGDKLGYGYPYNCAMIYAGYDDSSIGCINVYGGYFLYNNFNNNANIGSFNVGDSATNIGITVHDGVMLINKWYRQRTGTDDDAITLADGCEISEVTLDTPVVIDGVEYATWWQVQTAKPEFYTKLENTDKYLYRVGNSNAIKLGSLFANTGSETSIKENATIDVTIESMDSATNVAGTYTKASSAANWANGTIKFTGTGVAKITINSCELLVEVVGGYNVTQYSELKSGYNNILLNDIIMTSNGAFDLGAKALYGNGFTFDITQGNINRSANYGIIKVSNGVIDNIKIVGAIYTTYTDVYTENYSSSALYINGNATITNSYISNCRTPIRMDSGNATIKDTVLYGGRYANFDLRGGVVTFDNVTTVNEKITVDGTTVLGFGVLVYQSANANTKIIVKNNFTQYNWATEDDKNYLPGTAASYVDTAFGYDQFVYTYDGTDYVNLGIISISSNVLSSAIEVPNGYSAQDVQGKACVVTCDNTKNGTLLDSGIPTYEGWSATAQGAIKPTYTWNYPSEYNSASNTISTSFEEGSSYTLDPNFLTATKNGANLNVAVSMDGTDYTGKTITFTTSGNHTLTYTVTDPYNYDASATKSNSTYTFTVNISITVTAPEVKHADFTYTDGSETAIVDIGGKQYVMPNVTATDTTIGSTTVGDTTVYYPIVTCSPTGGSAISNSQYWYAPMFSAINITDYTGTVNDYAVTNKYNTTTPNSLPDTTIYGILSGTPYRSDSNTAYRSQEFKSGSGMTYKTEKTYKSTWGENKQLVCFYFTDTAGQTYYYYIQYVFAAHTYDESSGGCITPDTLITLADGTQVRVDQLTGNEQLLVWNLETGKLDSAPIMFIDSDAEAEVEVIKLRFSDGTEVKVIYEHGFWDYDLNKYVYLDKNATDYIGHTFAKQNGDTLEKVQLVDVVIETELTMAYSPVTVGYLCYFVNGMLSMPGGVGGLFNIFEVDAETMTYDFEAIEKDIETYGLYTYEELNAICPLSEEMFEAAGGQYLKISIGKGNLTIDELIAMINRYRGFI